VKEHRGGVSRYRLVLQTFAI